MTTPKASSTGQSIKELVLEQARWFVRNARATLKQAEQGELRSVQQLCDSERELVHAVNALAGSREGAALRQEALDLLTRFQELNTALLAYVQTTAARQSEAAPGSTKET